MRNTEVYVLFTDHSRKSHLDFCSAFSQKEKPFSYKWRGNGFFALMFKTTIH